MYTFFFNLVDLHTQSRHSTVGFEGQTYYSKTKDDF